MSKRNEGQYQDFIPYDKASKRERKRRDSQERNTWDIPPFTRIEESKKRKKDRRDKRKRDRYYDWDCEDDYD